MITIIEMNLNNFILNLLLFPNEINQMHCGWILKVSCRSEAYLSFTWSLNFSWTYEFRLWQLIDSQLKYIECTNCIFSILGKYKIDRNKKMKGAFQHLNECLDKKLTCKLGFHDERIFKIIVIFNAFYKVICNISTTEKYK